MQPLDVFPARVRQVTATKSQPLFQGVRVFLESDGRLRIFQRGQGGIVRVLDQQVTDVEVSRRRNTPHRLTLQNGETFEVLKANNCGCSDPLKRFDPRTAE